MKIGILGLAGAGKDTFATMLQQELSVLGATYELDRYARPLKELTAKVFNCTLEQLEDRVFKETKQTVYYPDMVAYCLLCLDQVCLFTNQEYHLAYNFIADNFDKRPLISPREFQQIFGTDVVRTVRPTAWVDILQSKEQNLIVPDVRFENELCDFNILIIRGEDVDKPTHSSELYAWELGYVHDEKQVMNYFILNDKCIRKLQHDAYITAKRLVKQGV